ESVLVCSPRDRLIIKSRVGNVYLANFNREGLRVVRGVHPPARRNASNSVPPSAGGETPHSGHLQNMERFRQSPRLVWLGKLPLNQYHQPMKFILLILT